MLKYLDFDKLIYIRLLVLFKENSLFIDIGAKILGRLISCIIGVHGKRSSAILEAIFA